MEDDVGSGVIECSNMAFLLVLCGLLPGHMMNSRWTPIPRIALYTTVCLYQFFRKASKRWRNCQNALRNLRTPQSCCSDSHGLLPGF